MIVKCAYCGVLPLDDLENLGRLAWVKHVREHHPTWLDGYPPSPMDTCTRCWAADGPGHQCEHIDGPGSADG